MSEKNPPIVLEVKNLTKRFAGLVAVNNLSMEIHKNRIHTLIGPNGSGKTTTVNLITGVLPANEGSIAFNGQEITGSQPYRIAQSGLGRTFQNIKLFSAMTVLENLMVGGHSKAKQSMPGFLINIPGARKEERQLREKSLEILEFLKLSHIKDEKVKNLPYGLQKMTELGRTLMLEPKMILLDEPAAGLIPSERAAFVETLQKLYETGIDLFLIEHNMDVVMSISHYITVLNFGSKIAEGTPKEVINNPEVIRAYLGDRFKEKSSSRVKEGGHGHA
ncbi:MAG: ABC transporter ATP-binding protein [Oscillospiraceae bacterium]